jgi:hypothetical protein
MNLRERVEALLPNWQSWYPSLFDAAADLGLIRARVCPPSQLALTNRHAAVNSEAIQAFRKQWSVEETEEEQAVAARLLRGIKTPSARQKNQLRRR